MADVDLQRGSTYRAPSSATGTPTPAASDGNRDQPYRQWVRWAVVSDVLAAGLAASVARAFSIAVYNDETFPTGGSLQISYRAVGLAVLFLWPVTSSVCGGYDLRTLLVGVEELRRVLRAGISLLALLGFVHFAGNVLLSRGYVGALIPLTVLFSGIGRLLLRRHIGRRHSTGRGHHNVVLVGPVDEVQRVCLQLLTRPSSAIDVVAYVADDVDDEPMESGPLSLIRSLPNRDAIKTMQDQGVPIDLLVRAGRPHHDEIWALARRSRELDAALAIAPHREDASANVAVSYVPLGNTPLLVVETPTMRSSSRAIKAIFDRLVAGTMIVVLSPLLVLIALAVLIRDGRPVLFRQPRVGRHGKQFTCFKFRTMQPDAEAQLADLRDLNEVDGPLFKIRNDPRVTPLGRRLRDHSLDELPQLFNVLSGSMSIVGPRPPLPCEAATYNEREARRLLVKPGLTGLWQVEGRSDLPWSDGVYLDLLYVDHWSPLLDLVIIARTVRTVFRPSGAY